MKAKFNYKESVIDSREFEIIKTVELSQENYEHFSKNLLEDYDFIKDVAKDCYINENEVAQCLLVLCQGSDDGILILSSGYSYARYSSFLPCARQIDMLNKYPSLNKHVKDMSELVKHYTEQALEFQVDGKCTISFNSVKNFLGMQDYDVQLFMNIMLERPEIETIDDSFGEYEVAIKKEYINPEEQLKELDQEEVDVICAKHILWKFDEGGEQADFSNCLLKDISLSYKDLCDANFDNAKLVNVNFERGEQCGSTFNGTRFYDCDLTHITAEDAEFKGAKFYNCKLQEGYFIHSNFVNAKIIQCSAWETSLHSCCIEGANFSDSEESGMILNGTSNNEQEWLSELVQKNMEIGQN